MLGDDAAAHVPNAIDHERSCMKAEVVYISPVNATLRKVERTVVVDTGYGEKCPVL